MTIDRIVCQTVVGRDCATAKPAASYRQEDPMKTLYAHWLSSLHAFSRAQLAAHGYLSLDYVRREMEPTTAPARHKASDSNLRAVPAMCCAAC